MKRRKQDLHFDYRQSEGSHIIGIDTGSKGGICSIVYPTVGHPLHLLLNLNGSDDSEAYNAISKALNHTPNVTDIVVERPPYFMGTMIPSSRIAVLFECYGKVLGYLVGRGYGDKIRMVDARIWQEPIRDALGYKRGKTKHSEWKRSLATYAKANHPDVANLTNQTTDALLIARWWHYKNPNPPSML